MPTPLCTTRTRRALPPCLIFILIHYNAHILSNVQISSKGRLKTPFLFFRRPSAETLPKSNKNPPSNKVCLLVKTRLQSPTSFQPPHTS
ncbi:hypothetical protein NEISICOT_01280 [Neisseria sicca ATCC 29256]|uniref:Uncharacterized protein n=1 Tax=Neisseria sicca ATCC 29256 TaxID=547045 RepID=C6M437_NEISI|nr:hypothetical protein NEISICOT_01280 [Neisseria sicca ATCC 29256]